MNRPTLTKSKTLGLLGGFAAWFVLAPALAAQPTTSGNPLRQGNDTLAETADSNAPAVDPIQPATSENRDDESEADQSVTTPPARERYTEDEIRQRLATVDQLELTDAQKAEAKKYYQDALQSTVELNKQIQRSAEESLKYTTDADEDKSKPIVRHSKDWYLKKLQEPIEGAINLKLKQIDLKREETSSLEETATKREERANIWNKRVKELEGAPTVRKQFLGSVQAKQQELEQRLSKVTTELNGITEITNEVTNARRTALIQGVARLEEELKALNAEKLATERAQEAYEPELELARRKAAAYSNSLTAIRGELSERRKQAANQQVQAAERQAARNKELIERNPNSLGTLTEINQGLTQELRQATEEIEQVERQKDSTTNRNDSVSTTYEQFVTSFGDTRLTQAGGQQLRDERSRLPRIAQLRREILQRSNQKSDLDFRRFEATQQLDDLENLDQQVAKVLDDVRPEDRAEAEPVVREMLKSQAEYLKSYIDTLDRLESQLSDLISVSEQLRRNTEQFEEFIAERDLWIRSCRPLWASQVQLGHQPSLHDWRPFYFQPGINAVAWSLNPENWWQSLLDLRNSAYRDPLLTAMLVIAFLLLLYFQQRARRQIRELGAEAIKRTCTEFLPSLRTLWLTMVVSLPWPLLLWGIGWLMRGAFVESEFSLALSQAARTSAWLLLLAEFSRQTCRTEGLGEAHLGWQRSALLQLRRYLRWVPVLVVPLVFWLVGLDVQSTEPLWSASLGRVLFLLVLVYATIALWRILISHSSSLYQLLTRGTESWLLNLHNAWRPVLVALPVALGVMATLGYYYTAEQLASRGLSTAAMLLALLVAGGLLRRWVLLNRRQLAREQARHRRAQAQAAADADEMSSIVEVAEETVDLTALSEATRKLLRALLFVAGVFGAILIWQDVFPALAWLDGIALPGTQRNDDPVSWGDMLRAFVALAVTYVAVRDLPSLLELVVLQHLPIDQGARYAISTLARYALLTAGIIVAGSLLDIGTSLGWLVAAMGVGLGFGLQEIFANFVSGIILLFERPIRVGDIITLGEKTGVVSRIRMRATTITDWDRKEYVVPNKDLVTERLLNWTLSDQLNRIVMEVGIAYGSDTDQAVEVIYQVLKDHPLVLEDPAPVISFEGFGDSTLNLVVRCYLPDLEKRLLTIHDLHTEINKRFNAEGIEIAFPQRDLHIRTAPAEWNVRPPNDHSTTNGQAETVGKTESQQDN